jgi:hypothetical protein
VSKHPGPFREPDDRIDASTLAILILVAFALSVPLALMIVSYQ